LVVIRLLNAQVASVPLKTKRNQRRSRDTISFVAELLRIFCSYSSKDERFREELETHLKILEHAGYIDFWTFRRIAPGGDWQKEILTGLDRANVILALVSANFLASEYCRDVEMQLALKRHRAGTAIVVPVILKTCVWKVTEFAQLQALPTGAKPVSHWRSHDDAWTDVVHGLQVRIKQLSSTGKSINTPVESSRHAQAAIARKALKEAERQVLSTALQEADGNESSAARNLGLKKSTLLDKLHKYRIL